MKRSRARVKVASNARDMVARIREVKRAARAALQERPPIIQAQGQGLLFIGLNATIYGTPEGQYRRSFELARGAFATAKATRRGMVEFKAWNTQPYARAVEFGTYAGRVEEEVGIARAQMPGIQPTPLVTGRTGEQWTLASLAHTRALVWMMLRLRVDVKAAVFRAWNK